MFAQKELNDQQLRYFGASLSGVLLAFGAIATWKWQALTVGVGLCVAAAALLVIYYAIPRLQRPIYNGFRKLTYPIQVVMTIVVLGTVYYLVLTPIGILLRLFGVNLRRKSEETSLWTARKGENEPSGYFKTY